MVVSIERPDRLLQACLLGHFRFSPCMALEGEQLILAVQHLGHGLSP